MLTIKNKDKLVGENFQNGLNVWTVIGVYEYGPTGQYQIHLRTTDPQADKVFVLTEEEGDSMLSGNLAPYKITDTFEPFNSVWVNYSNIANITSMLRTLKRIISHANN